MEQNVKQIEQLLAIVDERDLKRLEYNRQIADLVAPTFLTAVVEMLELPTDQIEWVDIDVTDSMVFTLKLSVTYTPGVDTSPFLGTAPTDNAAFVQKNLRVSLPLSHVFDSVEDIKKLLHRPPTTQATEPVQPVKFDPSAMSKDQIEQMLLFQHLTVGTKQ